jgi:hypothetical protein
MKCILLPGLLLMLGASTVHAAEPVSIQNAQSDFSAGQYRACIQKIANLLTGASAPARSLQRYDLFLLRAECLLRLNEAKLAAEAFDSAARVLKGTEHLQRIANARASADLIRASPALKFMSKGTAESLDIIPDESRAKAMAALLKDKLLVVKPQVADALTSLSIQTVRAVLPELTDAFMLEVAVAGPSAPETLTLAKSLGQHARTMLTEELNRYDEMVDELSSLATSPAEATAQDAPIRARGLLPGEKEQLRRSAEGLEAVEYTALDGRRMSLRVGGETAVWDAVLSLCAECRQRARVLLAP